MIRNKKQQFNVDEEDMIELIKVLRNLGSPLEDARALAFINNYQNQDFFAQVAIPSLNTKIEDLSPYYYQIREVMLGMPTLDTTKLMGMKEVFRSLE